jgi:hypothetical protein
MDWVARPWWDPDVALAWRQRGEDEDGDVGDSGSSNSTLVVYASWNGATEVAGWVVRGRGSVVGEEDDDDDDDDEEKEVLLVASPRTGFETELTIAYEETCRYLWAEALDAQGDVLRSSEIIDLDATTIRTESYNSAVSAELGLKSSSSLLNKTNTRTKPTNTARARGLSSTALALLGAGSGILMLMLIIASGVMVFIRRRRRVEYKSLEASDFDLGRVDDDDDEEEEEEKKKKGEDQGDCDAANRHGEADQGLEQSRRSEDEDRRALLPNTKGCNNK